MASSSPALEDGGIGASSEKFKRFMDSFKSAEAMAEMESARVRDSLLELKFGRYVPIQEAVYTSVFQ